MAAPEVRQPELRRLWALAGAIALIAVLVYLPALANGFTNWDDPGYVLDNAELGPLDARFLVWAFTTFRQGNWHPLTWLSLGVDHALFGTSPWGYHLVNVLLHGVNTLLVVLVAGALFGQRRGLSAGQRLGAAAIVGLLFAVHPLHVESVAWVSERKDVLCGVFYLLSVLFYLRFAAHHRQAHYWSSLGAFALALLAKPMAVSLPLVLLILDGYPLGRLTRPGWFPAALEKAPFLLLSATSSVATIVAQWRSGSVIGMQHLGLGSRLWVAERALGFYLAKTALPLNLSPVYPLASPVSPLRWDYLLSLAVVLAISVAAVALRRRIPLFGALWAAYLVMLLPVAGVVQVGQQAAADRYMYLPLLAPAIGIAAVILQVLQRRPDARTALMIPGALIAVVLSILTVRQIGVWRDTPALWTWVIAKQPGAAIAHYNFGEYLRGQGDLDGAGQSWRRAAELEPTFSWPLNQLGNLAVLHGDLVGARAYYERATRANPGDAMAQYNLGTFLEEQRQPAEARIHYDAFLRVVTPKLAYLIPEVQDRLSRLPPP